MKKLLFILLILYADVITSKYIGATFEKYKIVKLSGITDFSSEENMLLKLKLPIDEEDVEVLHANSVEGTVQLLIKPQMLDGVLLEAQNQQLTYEILVDDLGIMIYASSLQRSNTEALQGNSTFDRYMNFKEVEEYLQNIQTAHPEKVQVKSIGKSFEDRDISMVTIGDQTRRLKGQKKPIVFVEAGIHAREWITVSSAVYLIDKLLETPELTKDLEWRIVPVTNPDGYVNTWVKNRMWRKNMNNNKGKSCVGVDLNRNFDSHWLTRGASSNPCSQVHGGSTAFSEMETQAIRDAVLEVSSRVQAYVSVHSYGQLILHPPGVGLFEVPAEKTNLLTKVGKRMSDSILKTTSAKYTVGSPYEILYAAAGISMDWALETVKIPLAFTYEMRDTGKGGFLLPESDIKFAIEDLWTGMQILAEEIPLLSSTVESNAAEVLSAGDVTSGGETLLIGESGIASGISKAEQNEEEKEASLVIEESDVSEPAGQADDEMKTSIIIPAEEVSAGIVATNILKERDADISTRPETLS